MNSSPITRHTSLAVAALLLAAALSGCSYRSYREGDTRYTSLALGTSQAVAPFALKAGKEGDASFRSLESKGLTNDNAAAVAAIESAVGAAVRAATGAKSP